MSTPRSSVSGTGGSRRRLQRTWSATSGGSSKSDGSAGSAVSSSLPPGVRSPVAARVRQRQGIAFRSKDSGAVVVREAPTPAETAAVKLQSAYRGHAVRAEMSRQLAEERAKALLVAKAAADKEAEDAERKRAEEEEARRKAEEEEARRIAEEEEARRKAEEERRLREQEDAEARAKREAEEEAQRKAAAEEEARLLEARLREEARLKAEREREEEEARAAMEAARLRKQQEAEAAAAAKLAEERAKQAEEKRRAEEEARRRAEEEAREAEEEERRKQIIELEDALADAEIKAKKDQETIQRLESKVTELTPPPTKDVALDAKPIDDSIFLQERDNIIAVQEARIDLLTAEVRKLSGGIDQIEDQVEVMQTKVVEGDSVVQSKSEEVEALREEVARLKEHIKEISAREFAMDSATKQNAELLRLLQAAEKTAEEAVEAREDAKRQVQEMQERHALRIKEAATAQALASKFERESKLNKAQLDNLKETLNERVAKVSDQLEGTTKEAAVRIQTMSDELRIRREKQYELLDKICKVEEKLGEEERKNEELVPQVKALQQRNLDLENQLAQANRWREAEVASARETRQELEQHIQRLQTEVDHTKEEAKLAKSQLSKMSESVVRLADKERSMQDLIDKAQEATRSKKGEIAVLQERVANLSDELMRAERELQTRRASNEPALQRQIQQLQEAMQDRDSQILVLKERLAQLTRQLAKSQGMSQATVQSGEGPATSSPHHGESTFHSPAPWNASQDSSFFDAPFGGPAPAWGTNTGAAPPSYGHGGISVPPPPHMPPFGPGQGRLVAPPPTSFPPSSVSASATATAPFRHGSNTPPVPASPGVSDHLLAMAAADEVLGLLGGGGGGGGARPGGRHTGSTSISSSGGGEGPSAIDGTSVSSVDGNSGFWMPSTSTVDERASSSHADTRSGSRSKPRRHSGKGASRPKSRSGKGGKSTSGTKKKPKPSPYEAPVRRSDSLPQIPPRSR